MKDTKRHHKMENVYFILVFISVLVVRNNGQYTAPECPRVAGYVYIEHTYPCYFYACYDGMLVSPRPYECPSDTNYYQLLDDSNVENACSSCAKVYMKPGKPDTPDKATTQQPTTMEPTTTSTDMTTTTPTESPDNSGPVAKEIHAIRINYHVLMGRWVMGVMSLRQCLQECEEIDDCLGFDYNPEDSSCWLHDLKSICSPVREKRGCIHFGLYNECPLTTPSTMGTSPGMTTPKTPTTTTESEFTMAFKGHHLANGTVIPLAMEMASPETCVAICRLDAECVGADFDTRSNSCWLHSMDTECGPLERKMACTHYRLKDGICDGTTMPAQTTAPTPGGETTTTPGGSGGSGGGGSGSGGSGSGGSGGGSGGSGSGGSGSGGSGVHLDPEQVTDGFVESVQGYHVPGGVRMYVDVTLRQCLDSCLISPYCLALDYDEREKVCYFHFRTTYCNQPQELHGVRHYKRLPCIRDVSNDVSATWYRFHVERGQLLCTGCTISFCMEYCLSDEECAGLDFDIRNLGCYLFTPETVCGPLIPKDFCIHVSRDACVPDALVGLPTENLALVNYPAPSALPSGWQAYPGIRVRNGVQIGGSHLEPNQCVSMCEVETGCLSGDYDTADGSCWLHLTPERQCGQVEVSDTVFHFKRERCDSVYGVMEPYISAIWTSP